MAISMRVTEKENELIKTFAKNNGVSTSEFIKNIVMAHIENEYDLKAYEKAMEEYKKNSKTYSLKEVIESYGKKV